MTDLSPITPAPVLAKRLWADQRKALPDRACAALAKEAVGPSDEELLELSQYHCVSYTMSDGSVVYPMQEGSDMRDSVLSFARAVLARYGSTPTPIPVSERLPGAEDCDAEGRCWWFSYLNFTKLRSYTTAKSALVAGATHWLPAHAIPLLQENTDD